jgi:hypothetical protein
MRSDRWFRRRLEHCNYSWHHASCKLSMHGEARKASDPFYMQASAHLYLLTMLVMIASVLSQVSLQNLKSLLFPPCTKRRKTSRFYLAFANDRLLQTRSTVTEPTNSLDLCRKTSSMRAPMAQKQTNSSAMSIRMGRTRRFVCSIRRQICNHHLVGQALFYGSLTLTPWLC